MSVMQGITEDVPFDHGAADALVTACTNAASAIEGQTGSRASWVAHGLEDFKGYYAQLFEQNGRTQASDASHLATRLRQVATAVGDLKASATAEQNRRQTARDWKARQEARGFWDKVSDWFTGGEPPPVGGPDPTKNLSVPPYSPPPREPLSGNGSTGTSSARPANLRSFASNSRGANDALAPHPGRLRTAYDAFTGSCTWGSLDAAGVWGGFAAYLTANGQDVSWADTVAGAFEAAGSSGVVTTSNAAITASLQTAGVNASRDDLVITAPEAIGAPPTTGYANDPVNTATGNFLEPETDLTFGGGAASLRLTRMYNSVHPAVGAFGPGWSSWTEAGLLFDDGGARWVRDDGRHVLFPRQGDGWGRATTEAFWLTARPDGHAITDNTGARWEFDAAGRLAATSVGPGSRVVLSWDGTRLVRLTHQRGRRIDLTWSDDRVVAAEASDGRRVTYDYDDAGRLVLATSPQGTRRYDWNDAGLVHRVTDADGVIELENTYDDRSRVVEQRSPHGRVTRFAYLPGHVTVVSDPDGSRANTWIHDNRGRLVGVVDAHDQRQSMARDQYGQVVMTTERDGSITVREYDERSRLTAEVTPSGARVETAWDEHDRVVSVTVEGGDAPATTRFEYDGLERNPHTIIDAEGGRTGFTWADGLLTETVDPTGARVTMAHDEHGDLVAMADGLGNTARLERDAAGRIVASTTPLGHRTTFTWADERLAARTDPDGGTWRFEHTPAGRIAAVIDPFGARTEYGHDEAGETASVTDPLGRTTSRVFDALGNLARTELPDGSTWVFTHDALSRLVATIDPEGGEWRWEYDLNGTPVRAIDPTDRTTVVTRSTDRTVTRTGSVREDGPASTLVTDRIGRIVSVTQPGYGSQLTRYDRCGRPVEYVDPDGNVTSLERDAAGRVLGLRRPGGATTRYTYDARGKLASVTDAAGATTTFTIDADGRLESELGPTGEVLRYEYDANGRVTASVRPGLGRTTWAYDLVGRVVAIRSRQWGLRRFAYDAAGQLVEAQDALGGVTRYRYDLNGRAVEVTDPLGHTTVRSFNARDQKVEEVDPLGRRKHVGYDAAGRLAWHEYGTGERVAWAYDDDGALSRVSLDGETVAQHQRDFATNTLTILDRTDPAGEVTHRLRWDRRGHLVERSRGDDTVHWAYDVDGRCAAVAAPNGATTRYEYDPVGRRVAVDAAGAGRVQLTLDAAGRLVAATAPGAEQAWVHEDGDVVSHTLTRGGETSRTEVERGADGRIATIVRDGVRTEYGHDAAGQLVSATTGAATQRWEYDAGGRLVREADGPTTRTYAHDDAGQLVRRDADGVVTTYSYDAAGRRTGEVGPHGETTFTWSPMGWLSAIEGPHGHTSVHVDALGELARVNDADVFWNIAERSVAPVQVGGDAVTAAPGFLSDGAGWLATGWRTERGDAVDPWALATGSTHGPISLGASGQVVFAGLEWLGERVNDPASRGFLSPDPLDPTLGAPWAGNPYSYAGNDPLHALDPTGLRPVTDKELADYTHAAHTGNFWERNGDTIVGGLVTAAGVAIMFAPIPGAQIIGAGIASAGINVVTQTLQKPGMPIDYVEVGINGVLGAIPLGRAATVFSAFGRGAGAGAATGLVTGIYTGVRDGLSGSDLVSSVAQSVGMGALFGGILNGIGHVASTPKPSTSTDLVPVNPAPSQAPPAPAPAAPAPSTELVLYRPPSTELVLYQPPTPAPVAPTAPPGPLALPPGAPPPLALPPGPSAPLALPPGAPPLPALPAPPRMLALPPGPSAG